MARVNNKRESIERSIALNQESNVTSWLVTDQSECLETAIIFLLPNCH